MATKITRTELTKILKKHRDWVSSFGLKGERADLRGANLYEADLYRANLYRANLYEANLCEADLCGANLCGANLRGADLRGADLYRANLRGADLCGADLYRADLRGADLYRANLYEANLCEADLCGANLCGANLCECKNLNYPIACPEKGSFVGFKKVRDDLIVELEIPEDALRSSATSRKCRASKAKVISITTKDGTPTDVKSVASTWDRAFVYTVGETVSVDNFDTDRWNECAPGIHFFITRDEAVNY